ncbi:MAG: UDP-N-acetylmuramate dehydrogenase [Anaerolineae bacterium]
MSEQKWALFAEQVKEVVPDRVLSDEPMARHTSIRIGGPADLYVRAESIEELCQLVRLARQQAVPYFILGKGSNILVSEKGIRGLVIENRCQGYELYAIGNGHLRGRLRAEGGASLPALAKFTAQKGWAGLEWAIGIPSSIAGAVVNNAGAHGYSIADPLEAVTVLTEEGETGRLGKDELALGYRTSRFKGQGNREVVLTAEFSLRRMAVELLANKMARYAEHRRLTQPVEPSAGSIFKNPPGNHAGRLIEKAGLKGTRVGDAQISPKHANFIVNLGQAKASQVLELIELAQQSVKDLFGVDLELEIELVGEW